MKCNDALRKRLQLLPEMERNRNTTTKSFASKILREMLDIDPSKRPAAEQIHRIFSLEMDDSLSDSETTSSKSLNEQSEEPSQIDVGEFSGKSIILITEL